MKFPIRALMTILILIPLLSQPVQAQNIQGLRWNIFLGQRFDYAVNVYLDRNGTVTETNHEVFVILNELPRIIDDIPLANDDPNIELWDYIPWITSYQCSLYFSNGTEFIDTDDASFSFAACPIGNWKLITDLYNGSEYEISQTLDTWSLNSTGVESNSTIRTTSSLMMSKNEGALLSRTHITEATATNYYQRFAVSVSKLISPNVWIPLLVGSSIMVVVLFIIAYRRRTLTSVK